MRLCLAEIMHAQTEQYVRFRLNMMKNAINHPKDFSNPVAVALLGFSYCFVTELLALACIIKMCREYTIIGVLNSYISYGIIVFVPNFAYASLPVGHSLKAVAPDLMHKRKRRFIKKRRCCFWILCFIYKIMKCFCSSFWYYFLPLIAI